jgi:excinuclease UvrABC nuclease subunit
MTKPITFTTLRRSYEYWNLLNPLDGKTIQSVGGNYMFVSATENGVTPIYVGIATDLSDRIPNHERMQDAIRHGATHVLAHTQASVIDRQLEEIDLIEYFQPILNVQHKRPSTGLFGLTG